MPMIVIIMKLVFKNHFKYKGLDNYNIFSKIISNINQLPEPSMACPCSRIYACLIIMKMIVISFIVA